jgi:hypothetical protein
MLVAVCSHKGSPGATTTALALAAACPAPAAMVEADMHGGDLAYRVRTRGGGVLPATPTVLTLAAAARGGPDPELVARTCVPLNPQVRVLPGPAAAEQATGIAQSWDYLAAALAASRMNVLVDLGRVHAGSPGLAVAAAADAVVLVGRGDPGSMLHLRERVSRLVPVLAGRSGRPPRLWCVLVGKARHGWAPVGEFKRVLAGSTAAPLVTGILPLVHDPAALQRLEAGEDPTGRLGRSLLLRSAAEVASQIHAGVGAAARPVEAS